MSFSEADEVVQGRLRLQRDLVLEEPVEMYVEQNEKNWMDLNRKQIKAYEYLCHIGEAKQWIEACSDQELPPVVELDDNLRNGVVLAKLAKKFKPDVVKKIFGEDVKLQFRHSDNINFFFTFCKTIELPDVFVFELTDLYDKKNIPKVIYNIHALAHLLAARKLAPAIKDLRGHLKFTNEELEQTQLQIEAMNLPDFNGAGAAVAKEMNLNPYDRLDKHFQQFPTQLALIQSKFIKVLHRNRFRKQSFEKLQAAIRGHLLRVSLMKIKKHLQENKLNIVHLQAVCRQYSTRKRFLKIRSYLKANPGAYTHFQARVKGFIHRRQFISQSATYKNLLPHIIKIQAMYKAFRTRMLFKQLHSNPTFKSIQFFHVDSEEYQQDLLLSDLRQKVVQTIRDIAQSESLINELDLKVALIVKNRMSIEDITKLSKKVQQAPAANEDIYALFKAQDAPSRKKQEIYQNILYLLQTNPVYLSNMVLDLRQMTSETIKKFVESSILTIFSYATHPREEYLLLNLFKLLIHREINDVDDLGDFIKSNPQFVRLVVNYIRGAKDRQFLQSVLQKPILQVFSSDLELDTDPISIYKKLVVKEETETGFKSQRKLDVSKEEALLDPVVKSEYDGVIKQVQQLTNDFLHLIISSLSRMPYGIRCIAKQLYSSLHSKFPNEPTNDILRIIGNLIFFRYINPAIIAPEAFDVVPSDKSLSIQQRKNLSEISKMLNSISVGRSTEPYIQEQHAKFQVFLQGVVDVVDVQDYFQIDTYTDMALTKKPTLIISPTELLGLHKLLLEQHVEATDPLHPLLNELGPLEDSIDDLLSKKSKEQTIVLLNTLIKQNDEELNQRQLFIETKRLVLLLMKQQQAKSLQDLLQLKSIDSTESEDLKKLITINLGLLQNKDIVTSIAKVDDIYLGYSR